MGLVELARRWVEPAPRPTPDAVRKARPLRNPAVVAERQADGTVVLTAPLLLLGRGYAGWLAKRMRAPETKSFELEPVGAFVWELCDGKRTFDAIAKRLCAEYKMSRVEAEAALAAFLQMLGQRRLIVLEPKG